MDIKINNNIKLTDLIEFNPQEWLPKGTIAKKISMDNLIPFTRDIRLRNKLISILIKLQLPAYIF